jgi:hypothetical protein
MKNKLIAICIVLISLSILGCPLPSPGYGYKNIGNYPEWVTECTISDAFLPDDDIKTYFDVSEAPDFSGYNSTCNFQFYNYFMDLFLVFSEDVKNLNFLSFGGTHKQDDGLIMITQTDENIFEYDCNFKSALSQEDYNMDIDGFYKIKHVRFERDNNHNGYNLYLKVLNRQVNPNEIKELGPYHFSKQ